MDDQQVTLLREIRDLLQRSIGNQEVVLRANEENNKIYRAAARRQLFAIILAVVAIVVVSLVFSSLFWR